MNQTQDSCRPDEKDILRALGPLRDGRNDGAEHHAAYALNWSVYPVAIGPTNGEFRKTLRVRTGGSEVFDFSSRFGLDAGAGRAEPGVRNVHRPTDGESLSSKLRSLDMLLDLSRISRVSDSVARRVLGFFAPRRTGLWELPGAHARVFVDPITLIEQLVTPDSRIASLLLSPFMESTYETVVDEDRFVFRSSCKLVGDFLDLRSAAYPRSNFGVARCLAYWLGSRGRACELEALAINLLDAGAPLTLPRMFGKVPVRLTCVVENCHYIVLQMQSLVHGAYWPRMFDRLRLEDIDSGLALEFSEQAAGSASLMWWGPCNFEVGAARCVPSVFAEGAGRLDRSGILKRLRENERFWPTSQDQGANRTILLLDEQICAGPTTRGELPPYFPPMKYGAVDGLPLHHRERVLDIIRRSPGPREIERMFADASVLRGSKLQFGRAVEGLPGFNPGRSDSDTARFRLRSALEHAAGSAEWEPGLAKRFDVSVRSVREWATELGPNPTRRWNEGLSPNINVIDPLARDSLAAEWVDALRALRLRGATAYGFDTEGWTELRISLLAWAVGYSPLTSREARQCSQSAASYLDDDELLKILKLADDDDAAVETRSGRESAPTTT